MKRKLFEEKRKMIDREQEIEKINEMNKMFTEVQRKQKILNINKNRVQSACAEKSSSLVKLESPEKLMTQVNLNLRQVANVKERKKILFNIIQDSMKEMNQLMA